MVDSERKREFRGHAFRTWAGRLRRCLAPGNSCESNPISAHSIQRGGPLSLLAESGHVYILHAPVDPSRRPESTFRRVGLKKALVFPGLCATHDQSLFKKIETEPFDSSREEQLRLHAYRAVLQETHACMESAARLQTSYLKACDLGMLSREVLSSAGLFATERMIVAYETWLYKEAWDRAITSPATARVEYDAFFYPGLEPKIAVSALFSLDNLQVRDDVARTALTVIPTADGTHAVFAYLPHEAALVRAELNAVLASAGPTQRYHLSRLLLERCQNIAFSPRLVDAMSADQRATILHFYNSTALANDPDFQSPLLSIFDQVA